MWFLFGDVSSCAGYLRWNTLFNRGTPWAFHIIMQNSMSDLDYFFSSLMETEFYCDLHVVYKFKKIAGRTDFSYHFRKVILCYKRIGYNLNVMR